MKLSYNYNCNSLETADLEYFKVFFCNSLETADLEYFKVFFNKSSNHSCLRERERKTP